MIPFNPNSKEFMKQLKDLERRMGEPYLANALRNRYQLMATLNGFVANGGMTCYPKINILIQQAKDAIDEALELCFKYGLTAKDLHKEPLCDEDYKE